MQKQYTSEPSTPPHLKDNVLFFSRLVYETGIIVGLRSLFSFHSLVFPCLTSYFYIRGDMVNIYRNFASYRGNNNFSATVRQLKEHRAHCETGVSHPFLSSIKQHVV
jgi:hypothetical protein